MFCKFYFNKFTSEKLSISVADPDLHYFAKSGSRTESYGSASSTVFLTISCCQKFTNLIVAIVEVNKYLLSGPAPKWKVDQKDQRTTGYAKLGPA
jgi:hypothetical protein